MARGHRRASSWSHRVTAAVAMSLALVLASPVEAGWLGNLRGGSAGGTPKPIGDELSLPPHTRLAKRIEQVSWTPRVFLLHDFLSPEECDYIIAKATPILAKSSVVDASTGGSMDSDIRTSSGMFFNRGQDEVVARIEDRIAEWTMIPVENGEGLQVLRYYEGQKYEAHHDYFYDSINNNPATGGQRMATVLSYLADTEEGGETVFPTSLAKPHMGDPAYSKCAQAGLSVKPKKGLAVLFYSTDPQGKEEPHSLHGACPVIQGVKWSMAKWMHLGAFGPKPARKRGACENDEEGCGGWAASGECSRNPGFMLASCRKSCKVC